MRTVVIIEGAEGIGVSVCKAFQEAGDKVVVVCMEEHAAQAQAFHAETSLPAYVWDLMDGAACQEGMKTIERQHGPIDVLIHTGHTYQTVPLSEMTMGQWLSALHTHMTSFFCLSQSLLQSFSRRINGRIIAIGCAPPAERGLTHYSASQAGVIGFAKSLALELAPYGTTVNVIAMGDVRPKDPEDMETDILEKAMRSVPLQRMGSPEEVAALAVFLASPAASFITGTTLHMDGGRWMNGFLH